MKIKHLIISLLITFSSHSKENILLDDQEQRELFLRKIQENSNNFPSNHTKNIKGFIGQLQTSINHSGSDIGGNFSNITSETNWCRGQINHLKKYKKMAIKKLNQKSDYFNANQVFIAGFIKSLKSGGSSKTFTKKSIERGLKISSFIGVSNNQNSNKKNRVIFNILNQYYTFIIETVAIKLDLLSHVPYLFRNENPDIFFDMLAYEQNFVYFAKEQLLWVNSNLTKQVFINDKLEIVPIGSSSEFLTVALVLAHYTKNDLVNSLWNNRFACSIDQLLTLSQEIESYLQGNYDIYEDDRIAVNEVYFELKTILNNISQSDSCQ